MAAARGGPTHPTPEGSGCLWEVAWGRWEVGWKKEKVQSLAPERASELCPGWGLAWQGRGRGIRPWWGRGPADPCEPPAPLRIPRWVHQGHRRGARCPRSLGSQRATLGLQGDLRGDLRGRASSVPGASASFPKASRPQVALSATCLLRAPWCQGLSRQPKWSWSPGLSLLVSGSPHLL